MNTLKSVSNEMEYDHKIVILDIPLLDTDYYIMSLVFIHIILILIQYKSYSAHNFQS